MKTPLEVLIKATRQERQRLEEPKNRTRYFMFGKISERTTRDGYEIIFENAPERVRREAAWSATRGSLFKIGDFFISGSMEVIDRGFKILLPVQELRRLEIDNELLKRSTDIGIDYIMDTRDLVENLADFLERKSSYDNPFVSALMKKAKVIPASSNVRAHKYSDLNPSQNSGIEKALSQQVTFFWGPPGTGKTKTLGALAATLVLAKRRVLLAAMGNNALDQLLLTTLQRLGTQAKLISVARLGKQMVEEAKQYSGEAFKTSKFGAKRAGMKWSEHVRNASIVAGNFAFLTFPHSPFLGRFDYVLIDEISMANVPSLAAASFFAETGMVLGGDPEQLPPVYPEDAEEPNQWFRDNVFEVAEVEDFHDPRVAFLDTQYRMQQEIGDLVSKMFYEGALKTGTQYLPMLTNLSSRVIFLNCAGTVRTTDEAYFETQEQRRFNEVHAESAVKAIETCLKAGVAPPDIGVIAPYNAQMVTIRKKIRERLGRRTSRLEDLRVSTVHSFQGQERRVVVIDFTDDNVNPTFLTAKRELVNVALSRAKEQLVIVGNQDYLQSRDYFREHEVEMFKEMLRHSHVTDSLNLQAGPSTATSQPMDSNKPRTVPIMSPDPQDSNSQIPAENTTWPLSTWLLVGVAVLIVILFILSSL